jgi:hypothetical protein
MGISAGPSGVSDGLVFQIDAANSKSYSGSGNTVFNLANSGIATTIVTGIVFDNDYKKNLNFNGSSGYMFSNDTSMNFSSSNFTIQTTLKLNGLSNGFTGAYGSVICAGAALTNNSSILQFLGSSSSHYGVGLWHQPTSSTIGRNYNFQTNKIYNIAVVKNSTQVEFFVDGTSIGTTTTSNNFNFTANGFAIGRWYYSGFEQYLKGNLYEFKAYNKALSNNEILLNYNATKKRFYPEENIVTNGLVLNIDPNKSNSYSGYGNTAYDLSGFGNTATLINGTGFIGINGGAFLFDGTNDYISMGTASSVKPTQLTFACFFKINAITSVNVIAGKQGLGSGSASFALVVQNGQLHFRISNSSGTEYNASTAFSNTSNYNYAVGTYDGSNLRLYLNGASVGSSSVSISIAYSDSYPLLMGYYASSFATNMSIGSLKLYNRALTATEIAQNFNALRGRYNI